MYILAYKVWNDGAVEVVERRALKFRVYRIFSSHDPKEIDEHVFCAEAKDYLMIPVSRFDGCIYAREVLKRLGVEFEPLTVFLRKRGLLDEDLKRIILSKSI